MFSINTSQQLAFINAVLEEANCPFHLDVNNIYVNSLNHNYDAVAILKSLKGERIVYGHVSGHGHDKSVQLNLFFNPLDALIIFFTLTGIDCRSHN
ncbi:MAG: DUF692 family protein [Methylococcales bacterium]|nr:DUF692 family protein [Methylococcales bacterium]